MTIRIRIEPEILEKIAKLVEEKKYKTIHDFINLSIENQLQDELDDESEKFGISTSIKNNDFDVLPQINFESIKPIKLNESKISDVRYSSYGPGASGLIWIFQNRFFPIKVALHSLANLMNETKSTRIELDSWKTHAGDKALSIANRLYEVGKTDYSIGLPSSNEKLEKKFARKKDKKNKILVKLESSKKRFSDQFIGRVIQKEKGNIIFSGACFEMGLIDAEKTEDVWNVYITETGNKFLSLPNPIIDKFLRGESNIIKNSLSEQEAEFILKDIIPKFELENKIVNSILEINEKEFDKKIIEDIFEREKSNYTDDFLNHNNVKEIQRKHHSSIEKDFSEVNDNNTRMWIIQRYLELQIIASIGRLIELGIIHKEFVGREPHYYFTSKVNPNF